MAKTTLPMELFVGGEESLMVRVLLWVCALQAV